MKKHKLELGYKIFRESFKVLIITALLSSIGGIALRSVQEKLLVILPLLIILPALNGMVGDFGIIIVSKFTTFLSLKQIKRPLTHSTPLKHLFAIILPIAIISAIYLSVLASLFAYLRGFALDINIFIKILAIILLTTIFILFVIFIVAILGGMYIHKRNQDPDDLLIPITTSIADLGSMILYSLLVILFF